MEGATLNPFIGKKVRTRWPEDNSFYEAVITDYNAAKVCLAFIVLVEIIVQLLRRCENPCT